MGHPQPIKIVITKVSQISDNLWYMLCVIKVLLKLFFVRTHKATRN